ncbi:MAG: hypothetical protein HOP33_17900 [Verrucomicrobia bacterium]|nr:hypothetical protein [Verrucomicrobiota bacterium]
MSESKPHESGMRADIQRLLQTEGSEEVLSKLLLRKLSQQQTWEDSEKVKARKTELKECFDLYQRNHNFVVGQLVRWKSGLKNRKRPAYGEPVIVVEVLPEPVHDPTEEAGSAYFREHLTVVLGLLDIDGDFVLFHFDSRRFEPVT